MKALLRMFSRREPISRKFSLLHNGGKVLDQQEIETIIVGKSRPRTTKKERSKGLRPTAFKVKLRGERKRRRVYWRSAEGQPTGEHYRQWRYLIELEGQQFILTTLGTPGKNEAPEREELPYFTDLTK